MSNVGKNDIRWIKTDTACAGTIPGAFWNDPAQYLAAHGRTLKSSGFHRETFVMDAGKDNGQVIVKYFILKTLQEKMKWRIGAAAPRKEWEILTSLAELDVPVPSPVAFGWLNAGSMIRVWLLIRFIPGTVTFDQMNPPSDPCRLAAPARTLADALARLHIAGTWHGDLHSGNLLFQPETGTWLITDFQHARQGMPGRMEMVSDLVQLHHCLGKKVPLGVRITFLRAYLDAIALLTNTVDQMEGNEWRILFDEIRVKSRQYSILQARKRNKRCLAANRDFAALADWLAPKPLPAEFEHGWVCRSISRQLAGDVVDLIADKTWFLDPDVQVLKNTGSAAVGIYTHPQGKLFIKQYRYKRRLRDKLRRFRRHSKAHVAWQASWRLYQLHITTPRSLMVVWTPRGGFLVQEYVPELVTSDFALRSLTVPAFAGQRTRLIHMLARETAFMHDRAVAHRDLKGSNLAVSRLASPDARVFLIDVHPVTFYTYLPWSARARDLARLFAALYPFSTTAEQRYFLRVYLKYQTEPIDLRQLIMDVRSRAEEKLLQKHGIRLGT